MNVGSAVGFVFEHGQWISHILLGALIGLIPFFGSTALTRYGIPVLGLCLPPRRRQARSLLPLSARADRARPDGRGRSAVGFSR